MYTFSPDANAVLVWLVWFLVLGALIFVNEVTRRFKYVGFVAFFILPFALTILWFTVLSDTLYTGWFHIAKVYTATAACIGFWCIRYVNIKSKKLGEKIPLSATKFAWFFPPFILAANIVEAVLRDFELGRTYFGMAPTFDAGSGAEVIGGAWNYMNGIAGILSIILITGFVGIGLKKVTSSDKSKSILWPDMLWFYIIPYSLWNFAYVYNAIPHRSWYNGFALLLAAAICAFTVGKGSWVQHRGHTLALWVCFALTFPQFLDDSIWRVNSVYDPNIQFAVSFAALASNGLAVLYMIYKIVKHKRNPYSGELYSDLKGFQKIREQEDPESIRTPREES